MKQVINGISYITEEATLARFIIDAGFPVGFNDQNNLDPNAEPELKINANNVANHFLDFYKRTFESQLSLPFNNLKELISKNRNEKEILKLVESCIKHAMNIK